MAPLTFIHAADLHLGAPLKGLARSNETWGKRLQDAMLEAYGTLIKTAVDRQVDFVILAGDTFDSARNISYAGYRTFAEGLTKLDEAGIPVYICQGNHDPATSWRTELLRLPGNVHFFAVDGPSYELFPPKSATPSCVLAGTGYLTERWDRRRNVLTGLSRKQIASALAEENRAMPALAVGVIHTDLTKEGSYAPATRAALVECNLDYWALGHIHKRMVDDEANPTVVYPGVLQGHDINESGPKGFYLVTLEQGRPNKAEFIAASPVLWDNITVDVSEAETIADIASMVEAEALVRLADGAPAQALCFRATLVGTTPLSGTLKSSEILEEMADRITEHADLYCDKVTSATRTPRDMDALRAGSLFASELILQADAAKVNPEAIREKATQAVSKYASDIPDDLDWSSLVDEAIDDLLNKLMGGE